MADDRNPSPDEMRARTGLGIGLAVGVAIGVSMGMALGNWILGIGIGLAIGVALSVAFRGSAGGRGDAAEGDVDDPDSADGVQDGRDPSA
ncbi:hypothetical protein M4D51_13865 [Microbacterium sp. p3-SID338]|uniref:hypothetical protein n=1 Tax=unclassified Microbacterium TaxID=2609290 RepID=UPI0007888571|nr:MULTISPECIES: hypothetical protein [unclassified Microbacterium]KYK00402.1 hypothetical protein AUV07_00685 [Microbacterium sp. CH1]MCT1396812.1 hypothetical protein [Microbacterium sp. p3-SID338]PMC03916.1 hypothetical protein CJ226_07770 [Microbacterium sp. UMB0228]